jgi:hypothetical protein
LQTFQNKAARILKKTVHEQTGKSLIKKSQEMIIERVKPVDDDKSQIQEPGQYNLQDKLCVRQG